MKSGIGSYLAKLDIYGHPIGVHYKGKGDFRTQFGGFCTLITFGLILFSVLTLSVAYLDETKQDE